MTSLYPELNFDPWKGPRMAHQPWISRQISDDLCGFAYPRRATNVAVTPITFHLETRLV